MTFFHVESSQSTRFYEGEFGKPYPRDGEALLLGDWVPEGIHVKIVRGAQLPDMLFPESSVVSPQFVQILRDNNATGYGLFNVPLVRNGIVIANYFGVKLLGRGGPFDPVRSGARYDAHGLLSDYEAVYMDESQWDGSDVFAIPGLGTHMFVVDRIAKAMKKARLKNVRLTPNEECSSPPKRIKAKLEALAAERKQAPQPSAQKVAAPSGPVSRFPPSFDFTVFTQKLADTRAVLARIDEGAALPTDESEAAGFTASLFEDLTENLAMQDRMFGRQPDFAQINALLRSVPTLIDQLRRCIAERPVSAPRVLAAAYRLTRTAVDYVPPYSVAWAKLLAICQGLINGYKNQGYSEAEIERMIHEQVRNLSINNKLK